MPYDFDITSSTQNHSFQANERQPTTSAAASSSSQPTASGLLSNIPQREGTPAPAFVGPDQGIALSGPHKRRANEGILERISAYSKATLGDGYPSSQKEGRRTPEGHSLRIFVNANGILNFRGEQLKAAVEGHVFCAVNAPTLMLWIDKDNLLSMDDFAKRFGLYKLTFEKYAKADHTLTPRGDQMLRRDQGHQVVRPTAVHMTQFQELRALPNSKTSLVEFCRDMNLPAKDFGSLMRANGTPTERGERCLAAAARKLNRPVPSRGRTGPASGAASGNS
jgi:hypothetical protein